MKKTLDFTPVTKKQKTRFPVARSNSISENRLSKGLASVKVSYIYSHDIAVPFGAMFTKFTHKTKLNKAGKKSVRLNVLRFSAVALLVVIAMTFTTFTATRAANSEIVPNADYGTMDWVTNGSNDATCSSGTHCPKVADGSAHTTAGYISTDNSQATMTDEFDLTTLSNVDTATSIVVSIYARSNTNANGGQLDDVDVDLYIGGSYQGAYTLTPAYSTSVWTKYSTTAFTGSWSQSDVDGARIQLTRVVQGSGNPTNQRDYIYVSSVYADVEYSQTTTLNQSSYRWFNNTDASPPTTWSQTLGGASGDYGLSVIEDSFGNIVTAGYTQSYGGSDLDVLLTKYSSSGVEQWSKTWGGSSTDRGQSVIEDSSGNFIVTGSTQSYGGTDDDLLLIKFNSSGVEQWSKTWGGTSYDGGADIIEDSSGNYIVVGSTQSYGGTDYDVTLIKFNSSGVEQWSKTWGGASDDTGNSVVEDSSGNFIVTGYTKSYGGSDEDVSLIKFNSSGVEQWSKTWGGATSDTGLSVIEDSSGNFVVTGRTQSYGAGSNDLFLVKFNSSGVEQWSKTWGGSLSDEGVEVIEDSAGNYIVTGYTKSYGGSDDDAVLAKFNNSGVEQWSKIWGDTSGDQGLSVIEDSSSNFVVTGYSGSYGAGTVNAVLNRYDSDGDIASCTMCSTETVTEADETVTEADETVTEADETVTEADETVTEADESVQTLVHAGTVGTYMNALGGSASDSANGIIEDSSGNYFVTGSTSSYGVGSTDLYLAKYNSSGVEQWYKTIGWASNSTNGNALVEDSSGNIIVTGSTTFGNVVVLVKFNSSGVEQWTKTWGSAAGFDEGNSVIEDSSGNFVVVGNTNSYGAGSSDMFIAKFNSSGVEQWSKTWGGTGIDNGNDILENSAGDYVVTGLTTLYNAGGDMFLTKYDTSGAEQNTRTWGSTGSESGFSVVEDASNNIFVTGSTSSYGAGSNDVFLMKLNSSFTETWTKTWGDSGQEAGRGLVEDGEGNFIVVGDTDSYGAGDDDGLMVKFDSSGSQTWAKTWGVAPAGSETVSAVLENSSSNYIGVGATTGGFDGGNSESTLIIADPDETLCGGICANYNVAESDLLTATTNRTVSETNQNITEASPTITESNQTVAEVEVNESLTSTSIDVGTALAAEDTAATAPDEGTAFRLRLNLHVNIADLGAGGGTYKLQYAEESGTCDTSFTGETYADVGTTGIIRYYDNTNAYDGMPLTENANDPTHGSDGNYLQNYEESNNFTNSNTIAVSSDGVFDFALVDDGAPAETTYCFRVVDSGGGTLTTYTVIPEITTKAVALNQSAYRWFENEEPVGEGTFAQTIVGEANKYQQIQAVIEEANGDLVIAGNINGAGGNSEKLLISKLSSSGQVIWAKEWGSGTDGAYDLIKDSGGDYVVTGYTNTYGAGSYDMVLIKFNSSGVEQWSKSWGGSGWDEGQAIIEDSAGNYLVTGYTGSYGGSDQDVALVKFNSSGVEQWSKTWGGSSTDRGYDVTEDSSGNFIVTGMSESYGGSDTDIALIKFNSSGVEQWSKIWGGTSKDEGWAVIEDSSGNYIVTGDTISYSAGVGLVLIKFNSSGVEQWSKVMSGSGEGNDIFEDSSGNYIVGGDYSGGIATLEFSSSGTFINGISVAGDQSENGNSIVENINGDLTIVGGGSSALGPDHTYGTIIRVSSSFTLRDCSYCTTITGSESDETVTESDETVTEADETVTESDHSVTEANVSLNLGLFAGGDTWATTTNLPDGITAISGYGNEVIETSDGGYVTVGYTTKTLAADNDIVLTKFNSSGVEQWSKSWGGSDADQGFDVIEDSSGNLIVVGFTESYGGADRDVVLIKFNSAGVEQWSKIWGGSSADIGYSVIEDSSGNFIVTGETSSFGGADQDVVLIKFNSSGVEQWSKTWGGSDDDQGKSVIEDSTGNFIVTGSSLSYGGGDPDISLIKFNSSGVEQWSKTWGGSGNDYGNAVIEDSSGNFIVSGQTASYGGTDDDVALIKFNSSGVEQWSKTWGGSNSDIGNSLIEDASGNFIVSGQTASYGGADYDVALIKFNSSGVEQWSKTWGGSNSDIGNSLIEDASGNFIVSGQTASYGAGSTNLLLNKFNSSGQIANCSECTDETVTEADETVTEADETVTEADETVTEADQTVTEADENVQQISVNGIQGNVAVTFGSSSFEQNARGVTTDSSGNIFTVYDTQGWGYGFTEGVLTKFNSSGVEQWTKTWGGTGGEGLDAVIIDNAGDIVVVGSTLSYGGNDSDILIVKFNSSGVEQWSKTLGANSPDSIYGLIQDSSGDYVVTGLTESYGSGNKDIILSKFNTSGVEQWTKTWGGAGDDEWGRSVTEDSSGNYYVTGFTRTFGAGDYDIVVIKFNSSGVEQWAKTWGGTGDDRGQGIEIDNDGYVVVTGYSYSAGAGSGDVVLMKLNSAGAAQWIKTWGGSSLEEAYDVTIDTENNYYVAADTATYDEGGSDAALIKFNSDGEQQWTKTWGGSSDERAGAVTQNSATGEIVFTGDTTSDEYTPVGTGWDILVTISRTDTAACGGICISRDIAEANETTITLTDQTVTEADETVTEADETVTEVDQTATEELINDVHYIEPFLLNVGSPYAAANTQGSTRAVEAIFRLRSLVDISGKSLAIDGKTLKLQYAVRVGTCDTSFTGESYSDLTSSGGVAYYDQYSGVDLISNANDPTHSSHTIVNQTHVSSNNFSNANVIPVGQDGMFDFSITSGSTGGSYCFRIVESGGTLLDTYTVIPEFKTPPSTEQQLRHGQYFDAGGTKEVFFWSSLEW